MTIAITNKSRTIQVLNLSRAIAPVRGEYPRTIEHRDGTNERVMKRVVYADSITLLAGECKTGLPNEYRRAPDVMKAAKLRLITIEDEVVEAASAVAAPVADVDPEVVIVEEPATTNIKGRGSRHSG